MNIDSLQKIKPLGSKLLVKLLPLYSGHKLTLINNQKHYEQMRDAEVIAVGPKVREVKPGDKVMFRGHVGKWVDDPAVGGLYTAEPLYRSVEEEDVLAVYESESCAAA